MVKYIYKSRIVKRNTLRTTIIIFHIALACLNYNQMWNFSAILARNLLLKGALEANSLVTIYIGGRLLELQFWYEEHEMSFQVIVYFYPTCATYSWKDHRKHKSIQHLSYYYYYYYLFIFLLKTFFRWILKTF